jgi:hypothetical protein
LFGFGFDILDLLRGGLLLLASHCKSGDGKEGDDQCFIFHNDDFRCVFGLLLFLLIWRNYVAGWFFAMGCNPTVNDWRCSPKTDPAGNKLRKEKAPADFPPARQWIHHLKGEA